MELLNVTDARDKLQELMQCSICVEEFTDPRMLPCIHTFCLECLKQLYKRPNDRPTPTTHVLCPLCSRESIVPTGGLDELQKNFFIQHLMEFRQNIQLSITPSVACDICKDLYEGDEERKPATLRCLECRDHFCDMCAKAHTLQKLSKHHNIVEIGSETEENMRRISPTTKCTFHSQKPLDYYCPQCKKTVCVSCVLENHTFHGCEDVITVEKEFRQIIGWNASKISDYADELSSKEKSVEQRKENVLSRLEEIESEIQQRNLELKRIADNHTEFLMDQLSLIKQDQINGFQSEKAEIDKIRTNFKSFESYCNVLRLKGSTSDICSSVDALITRSDELEEEHEEFIALPCCIAEVSFEATDLEELVNSWSNDIFGRIQETYSKIENCIVIAGLFDGQSLTNDVFRINLHRPQEVSAEQRTPTKMQYGCAAAVYHNTMYLTGIGQRFDEVWNYHSDSGWEKCSSLVQGRSGHCAAFVDEILYICGGYVFSDRSVLDSVEAYNTVTEKCITVGKLFHCVWNSGNCVPFRSSLYIFGGSDKDYMSLNHVQVYDTKQNSCTLISEPMPRCNNLLRAVLWETSVILLGWNTCFIFNIETETWQEREQFKTDAYHFALALENGRVFVIGGGMNAIDETGSLEWTYSDDVSYVPLKNIIDDKPADWRNYANLEEPVLIHTYGKITLLLSDREEGEEEEQEEQEQEEQEQEEQEQEEQEKQEQEEQEQEEQEQEEQEQEEQEQKEQEDQEEEQELEQEEQEQEEQEQEEQEEQEDNEYN